MNIGILRADFKTAALNELENVYIKKNHLDQFLAFARQNDEIEEMVVLSTCNRVEIYFRASNLSLASYLIQNYISNIKELTIERISQILNENHNTEEVIYHLFRVTAGVESMVFGENEILMQVKNAYDAAVTSGTTQPTFNKLFQTAIATGKRVRSESDITKGSYSVSSIAIEAVRSHFASLFFEKKILIVGAGTMGLRALKKLDALNHPSLFMTNRTDGQLTTLKDDHAFTQIDYREMPGYIQHMDAIIFATGSDQYLLSKNDLLKMPSTNKVIVDLGIPRNVHPNVDSVEDATLFTIYGLQNIANETVKQRKKQLGLINAIITEEFARLNQWHIKRIEYEKVN